MIFLDVFGLLKKVENHEVATPVALIKSSKRKTEIIYLAGFSREKKLIGTF